MCNQISNVPSVSLQTAALMQVKEFADKQQTFSVHDITRVLREKTRNGEIEIPEVEVSGASFRFDIPHPKVKSIFDELWRTGVFDPFFTLNRNYNGTYYEYTPQQSITSNSTVPPTMPSILVSTPTVSKIDSTHTSIVKRIETYLENCRNRNFRPTLKQVQSAIKRGDVSTGWSCDDIRSVIESELHLQVIDNPDFVSASQVV